MKKLLFLLPALLLVGCGARTDKDICEDALQYFYNDKNIEITAFTGGSNGYYEGEVEFSGGIKPLWCSITEVEGYNSVTTRVDGEFNTGIEGVDY